jgi:protein-disulfide isomerase
MSYKTHKNPSRSMPWLLIVAAIVIMIIIALSSTLIIKGEDDRVAQETQDDARVAALESDHAPSLGPADAPVHIVEFLDPACGTCALFYPMVKQWLKEEPDLLRLSIRHVPFHDGADYAVRHVPFHDGADYAVQVLEAARAQDLYWETLERLLATQNQWTQNHRVLKDRILPVLEGVGLNLDRLETDLNNFDVRTRMEQDMKDAVTLKVSATPEYFVNGRPLPSFGQQQLLDLVLEELAKAGQTQ